MAVLNSTHEGILLVNTSGHIVLANEKLNELVGYAVEDLVGKNIANTTMDIASRLGYHSSEIGNLLAALGSGQAVLSDEMVFNLEQPVRRTLQRSEAPVHDADGQLIGWLIVLRDISEEKELEEAQEQLTEMIVHDLRSPLTAILGSMLSLVNSLLDIAKLESGELELQRSQVNLGLLCQDLLDTFQPGANEEGIILELDIARDTPIIDADNEKIQRVLVNLLDNALKFTPEGGSVTIRTSPGADKDVRIEIADTGPGIPEEFRQRIFDRFAQVPGRIGRRRGTGLGLAFSKLAVDAHGGEIWIEDNAGGGAVFVLSLPLHA
jgi:PAS domain S-box-containing protein